MEDEPYFSIFPYHYNQLIDALNYYGNSNKGSSWENKQMYEIREDLWEWYDYANE